MKPGSIDSLAKHLAVLADSSSLPASSLSRSDRKRLQSLFDAGVIEEVRAGAGRRLVVTKQTALRAFIQSLYPSGLDGFNGDLPAKSRAVAERRDSKKAKGENPATLLVRGFNGCAFRRDELRLPVADWTASAGVAALSLNFIDGWSFRGTLGLVENLETFWHIEKIAPFVDLAIFNEGRLGANILEWLNTSGMTGARIVHFPDYDPVGMDEYLRFKQACPERTELFRPPFLEELFTRYGKVQLLQDNSAILARLRKTTDSDVRYVVELMDRFGVGLEQEVLLIDPPACGICCLPEF